MSYSFLSSFGLTDKEIDLYEVLLAHGELSAGDVVRLSKLKRATAYQSLYSLEKKGLVTHFERGRKIHFRVESPTKLLELANLQLRTFEESHRQLMGVISSLNTKYVLAVEKPVISVLEGIEGIKQVYNDTLKVAKPIYAALTTDEVEPELKNWLRNVYSKKRASLKIPAYVLIAEDKMTAEYVSRNPTTLRTTKVIKRDKYPFQHEINIYGDKVAFIHYRKGDKLLGIIIQHPHVAKTMKALFDVAWDGVPNPA
jgi:sugar-specific transcriptional regulator TrmB